MDAVQDALTWLGLDSDLWARILWTASVFAGATALNMLLRRLAAARVRNAARRYAINKAINYTAGCAVLLALTLIWSQSAATIATYLGIVSAGVAIALHDPLTNLAGWLFLIVRRPFVVGDRIEIGAHAGDVIDVRMFQFSLIEIGNWVDADQSTGRILHMPNALVFREPIANYTEGFNFIWDEIPVTVTFESNWQRAKEILTEIVNQHSAIPSDTAAVASATTSGNRFSPRSPPPTTSTSRIPPSGSTTTSGKESRAPEAPRTPVRVRARPRIAKPSRCGRAKTRQGIPASGSPRRAGRRWR